MEYKNSIVENAIAYLEGQLAEGVSENMETFTNASMVKDFLFLKLGALEHEMFSVMFLDNRHRLIAYEDMFRGTIDGTSVYPREVAKAALKHNAAAVIFAHNHPSGVTDPSMADKKITDKLIEALRLLDIRTLDHIIVGRKTEDAYSFAEKGDL